jgi:hypothetical protein
MRLPCSPREILEFLNRDEPLQQKRLLLDILRSHARALNPHNIEMDRRVEYAVTQAEENPLIIRDRPTPSEFLSHFCYILGIAAEMDKKIQALAAQTPKDAKAIEDGLFEILVESSRVVPDKPDTMEYDRALHAVELFVRHPESKGLMRGLGENGEQPLLGRINEVVGGHIYSQTPICLEIGAAFQSFASTSMG